MVTEVLFTGFVLVLVLERLFELRLSRRNSAWARARGAVEYGRRHLPWMKLLHTGFFLSCIAEVWLLSRPFYPWLGAVCLALALASQALRYWTIATLGPRWNIAVLVLPGMPAEARGPFRFVKHPNYLAVIVEVFAVPAMHSAFLTAVVFSVLNAVLLTVRIRCEEAALHAHCEYSARLGERPRFLPRPGRA